MLTLLDIGSLPITRINLRRPNMKIVISSYFKGERAKARGAIRFWYPSSPGPDFWILLKLNNKNSNIKTNFLS